jgi:transposase-like protein
VIDGSVMAGRVLSMKVIAAVAAFVAGEPINVSEVCRAGGVSRKTFYKWAARCRAEGLGGLEPRSRAPRSSPRRVEAVVEDEIVGCRQRLADRGLDHGATTVHWHLSQDPAWQGRVPSVATIHRVFVRRGLVTPQPKKRPKGSWQRFEAPAPNEWWQIDAMDWVIRPGVVQVFNIIDDHSRVSVRSRAVSNATSVEAWTTFCQGAQQWGLPAGVLSDNGLSFSGRLHGFEVLFEANLRDAGIRPFTGRAFHPQTTGKVERFQQTLKKWLRQQSEALHGAAVDAHDRAGHEARSVAAEEHGDVGQLLGAPDPADRDRRDVLGAHLVDGSSLVRGAAASKRASAPVSNWPVTITFTVARRRELQRERAGRALTPLRNTDDSARSGDASTIDRAVRNSSGRGDPRRPASGAAARDTSSAGRSIERYAASSAPSVCMIGRLAAARC